jgi:hypothetical protein
MTSNITRTTASSRKAQEDAKTAFGKKVEPLIDRLSVDDYQRALHNEFDMGCIAPKHEPGPFFLESRDFDHSLF